MNQDAHAVLKGRFRASSGNAGRPTLPPRLRTDAFPPGVRRVASAEAAHSGRRKGLQGREGG